MTDYIPTTEKIKNAYLYAGLSSPYGLAVGPEQYERGFDRWLEQHDREVLEKSDKLEKQEILDLLDQGIEAVKKVSVLREKLFAELTKDSK